MGRSLHLRDVGSARQAFSGSCRLVGVLVAQTQALDSFITIYDAHGPVIVLGRTEPTHEIPVGAATAGHDAYFIPPMDFQRGIVIASATASGGATASAAGTHVTLIIE